jgi:hypothetical protein
MMANESLHRTHAVNSISCKELLSMINDEVEKGNYHFMC